MLTFTTEELEEMKKNDSMKVRVNTRSHNRRY